jgi:aryl-alcohol dehydrogenase-like predicted oxidoreductase
VDRLKENLAAADLELSGRELQDLNKAISKIAVVGERYPEALEKMTGI